MVDIKIDIEGLPEVKEVLEEVKSEALSAAGQAAYEAAQTVMDAWLDNGIWVLTGALRDSNYVSIPTKDDPRSEAGFTAPYTEIQELYHPEKPNYLENTYSQAFPDAIEKAGDQFELSFEGTRAVARHPEVSFFVEEEE